MGEVWGIWLCHGWGTAILGWLGWLGRSVSSLREAEEAAPATVGTEPTPPPLGRLCHGLGAHHLAPHV